jgi:hypothetical protein
MRMSVQLGRFLIRISCSMSDYNLMSLPNPRYDLPHFEHSLRAFPELSCPVCGLNTIRGDGWCDCRCKFWECIMCGSTFGRTHRVDVCAQFVKDVFS